jgi:hypothetical protein
MLVGLTVVLSSGVLFHTEAVDVLDYREPTIANAFQDNSFAYDPPSMDVAAVLAANSTNTTTIYEEDSYIYIYE